MKNIVLDSKGDIDKKLSLTEHYVDDLFTGALDDALDIRPKEGPKVVDSPKEYDMDTLLDKIGKSRMDSLTQDEKDFLYSM